MSEYNTYYCVVCKKTKNKVSLSKCPVKYTYHHEGYKEKYPDENKEVNLCNSCAH